MLKARSRNWLIRLCTRRWRVISRSRFQIRRLRTYDCLRMEVWQSHRSWDWCHAHFHHSRIQIVLEIGRLQSWGQPQWTSFRSWIPLTTLEAIKPLSKRKSVVKPLHRWKSRTRVSQRHQQSTKYRKFRGALTTKRLLTTRKRRVTLATIFSTT